MGLPQNKALMAKHATSLVGYYKQNQNLVSMFLTQVLTAINETPSLKPLIHSVKYRVKDPTHLKDKLIRKFEAGQNLDISSENLFVQINDLAGIRILHLYTRQIIVIDKILRKIFDDQGYDLRENPFVRTWDDESRAFYKELGFDVQESPSLYTSVHYVIGSTSKLKVTCEIQVRTLMEEVWGEVDHSMNYPRRTESIPCKEQLLVLARVTSSATRLVDSIFISMDDHQKRQARRKRR